MRLNKINLVVLLLGVTIITTSCRRKKETNAVITVLKADESPVGNASVRLYLADPETGKTVQNGIDVTKETNSSGQASFNYDDLYKLGQAGFAVLDIEVNNGAATGIIKIEEEENNEETIICQACP